MTASSLQVTNTRLEGIDEFEHHVDAPLDDFLANMPRLRKCKGLGDRDAAGMGKFHCYVRERNRPALLSDRGLGGRL